MMCLSCVPTACASRLIVQDLVHHVGMGNLLVSDTEFVRLARLLGRELVFDASRCNSIDSGFEYKRFMDSNAYSVATECPSSYGKVFRTGNSTVEGILRERADVITLSGVGMGLVRDVLKAANATSSQTDTLCDTFRPSRCVAASSHRLCSRPIVQRATMKSTYAGRSWICTGVCAGTSSSIECCMRARSRWTTGSARWRTVEIRRGKGFSRRSIGRLGVVGCLARSRAPSTARKAP